MENPENKNSDSGFSSYGKAMRTAGPLFTAGIQIAVAVGLMCFFGYLLDQRLGTTPWLMVGGIFLGAAAGLYLFIRTVNSLEKKSEEKETHTS
jgi:ATP synthase protein I